MPAIDIDPRFLNVVAGHDVDIPIFITIAIAQSLRGSDLKSFDDLPATITLDDHEASHHISGVLWIACIPKYSIY